MNRFAARVGLGLLGCLCAGLLDACNQPVDEVADAATTTDGAVRDAATDPLGPQITTGTLTGITGAVLHVQLQAEGGTRPYFWSLESGSSLPMGVSLDDDGWLDGMPSAPGRWTLVVKVTDVHGRWDSKTLDLVLSDPSANDRCSAPRPLVFSNGVAAVSDTLASATPDGVASTCYRPASQPDRFYSFDLAASANVSISTGSGSTFIPVLYLAGCLQPIDPTPCTSLLQAALPKGSYVVGVTGPPAPFTLTVSTSQTTSGGDGCMDATALDLSAGTALVQGSFLGAKQDFMDCGYGLDRVYSFTLSATSTVRVRDNTATKTDRSIRKGAFCATSTVAACRTSFDSELEAINLPAGTYYLVIGAHSSSATGNYSVQVTVAGETPRPVNDKCEGATPVALVNDQAVLSGDMVAAGNDPLAGTCGATKSRDLYFVLDLTKPSRLRIEESGTWYQRVQLLSGTCTASTSLVCGPDSDPLCVKDLQPGKYYLRVISDENATRQTFSIPITRLDPLVEPPNATCAAPEHLTLKAGIATATGTLAATGHNFALSCVTNSPTLHDLVYKVTLDKRTDLKVGVTSSEYRNFNVAVLSGSCESGTEVSCIARVYSQAQAIWGLDPGDYWVVVQGAPDSYSGACWTGEFTLTVTATPSAPQPANDRCSSPTPLTLDGPGKAVTLSGTLLGASNDFSDPSCSPTADFGGPDVVYDLDLKAGAKIRVSPLGTLPYSVGYYLTLGCGSTVGLGCSTPYSSGSSFTTGALPAGHYYLVVDSRPDLTQPGDFALVVDTL